MTETSPLLPSWPWLMIALFVLATTIINLWRRRRNSHEQHRKRRSLPPSTSYMQPISGDTFNAGAGADTGMPQLSSALESELRALMRARRKIDAIKLARKQLGLDLREAKELVERL